MTKTFLGFAIERERVRLAKESGQPAPWTSDEVLQTAFFCNVFREDDKTTRWFRDNIRDQVRHHPGKSVLACAAFRWFNYVPTGEALRDLLVGTWDAGEAWDRLKNMPQVVSGAYLIKSPTGMGKAAGLIQCIDTVAGEAWSIGRASEMGQWPLQKVHQRLMEFPLLGRFMAYEIVTDLRHTCVLSQAPDVASWASAGPGCARGLGWIHDTAFSYTSDRDQEVMLDLMRDLLREVNRAWPWPERPWEMREVEHVLCEYSKYRTACAGGRVKRKYPRS